MPLVNYGSDSDSGDDDSTPVVAPAPAPAPPPSKKRGPVKLTFQAKKFSDDEVDADDGEPSKKKPKLGGVGGIKDLGKSGKGKSALLDMLPAPKRALPPPKPEASGSGSGSGRVLGGGAGVNGKGKAKEADLDPEQEEPLSDQSFLPAAIRKGKAKATQEPAFDIFGLATAAPTPPLTVPTPSLKPPTISSAPLAPDYIPPPPSLSDPYPGYYQTPSGAWAAYDPKYYHDFFAAEAEAAKPKDRNWEGVDLDKERDGMVEVDVLDGLRDEQRLAEERRKLTAPIVGNEEDKNKAITKSYSKAGQRGQLSSLLKDAQMNRAALEERIAANKRTKRESGTKYGF